MREPHKKSDRALPLGAIQQLGSSSTSAYTIPMANMSWPQVVERKWSCKCGKPLSRERVALKTKRVGKAAAWRVEKERFALICPEDGIVAWEGHDA